MIENEIGQDQYAEQNNVQLTEQFDDGDVAQEQENEQEIKQDQEAELNVENTVEQFGAAAALDGTDGDSPDPNGAP